MTGFEMDAVYAGTLDFDRGPMDPRPKWWRAAGQDTSTDYADLITILRIMGMPRCVQAADAIAALVAEQDAAVAALVVQPEPVAGETWHILRAGATACQTLTIDEITPHTVMFKPERYSTTGERVVRDMIRFIERAEVKQPVLAAAQ
jgi:hypothetical protein